MNIQRLSFLDANVYSMMSHRQVFWTERQGRNLPLEFFVKVGENCANIGGVEPVVVDGDGVLEVEDLVVPTSRSKNQG